MAYPKIPLIVLITLFLSSPAHASDFTGLISLVIAMPTLVISNILIALFFAFRPSHLQKLFAKILFIPIILICTIIFFIDALPKFIKSVPFIEIESLLSLDPDEYGVLFFFGYIGLLSLLIYLLKKIIFRVLSNDQQTNNL